ncbi:MAG: hypothetical protein ACE364_08780 [Chlorobiota bacterium]
MYKINSLKFTFLIFIFSLITVSFSKEKEVEIAVLENEKFKIEYPSDWELDESGNMGTSFILFSPVDKLNENFNTNINLIIQDVSAYNITFDQYVELSEKQIKTMIIDSKIVFSDLVTTESNQYQKLIFTGKQGVYDLKFEQFYIMRGPKVYVLTLTCRQEEFDDFQQLGEQIMNSFQIKN